MPFFILSGWQDYWLTSFANDPEGVFPKEKACYSLLSFRVSFFQLLLPASCQHIEKTKPGTFVPGFFLCRGGRIIGSLRSLMILRGCFQKKKPAIRFSHFGFRFSNCFCQQAVNTLKKQNPALSCQAFSCVGVAGLPTA